MHIHPNAKHHHRLLRLGLAVTLAVVLASAGAPAGDSTAQAQTGRQPEGGTAASRTTAYLPLITGVNGGGGPAKQPGPTATPPADPTGTPEPPVGGPSETERIYWGAYIDGAQYGEDNPPWDMGAVEQFEAHAGKKISILHFGLPWAAPAPCWPGNSGGSAYYPFQPSLMTALRERGTIPMIDWATWSRCGTTTYEPEKFSLSAIAGGAHDDFIRGWAEAARDWGHPFFLRLDWEMNGDWFPWSERAPGNAPGEFVKMWRHVHDIFSGVGADNVNWVWCPNTVYPEAIPLEGLYPGDEYVDWTCFDGYNKLPAENDTGKWMSFYEVVQPTYAALLDLAPGKPIMIGETSSTEAGGSKADWITQALTEDLPVRFPQIKALVWFNWNCEGYDWVIETSGAAQEAFAKGIAGEYYAGNEFNSLSASPIPPP